MKLLKSLILGTAAVFAASWGAQAADLPVKAKPVEYVRICSAYGAGFYYIPGTDICLRVGGYMWYDVQVNNRAEGVDIGNSPQVNNNYGPLSTRVRGVFIMDARTATQYGTLRSYVAMGLYWTSCGNAVTTSAASASTGAGAANGCSQTYESGAAGPGGDLSTYMERAFIQFAGFTAGYVGSFFDFNPNYTITSLNTTSFKWTPAIAYTIQYGNGVSTTLSMEDPTPRRSQLGGCVPAGLVPAVPVAPWINTCVAAQAAYAGTTFTGGTGYGGAQAPVIVANARVDQAWGSAQVAVAGHELKVNEALANVAIADRWGWAALGGIEVKLPWGPGDSVMLQGMWGSGAAEFSGITNFPVLSFASVGRRNAAGQGPVFDVMDSFINIAGGRQDLVQQFAINGQIRHFWNPMLRTAVFAGYNEQNMPASATAFSYPDLRLFQAGINTTWSPVKDLDLGVELLWTNIQTVCVAPCVPTALGNNNASADVISGVFRARRNW